MTPPFQVTVMIPALNEAGVIGKVVAGIPRDFVSRIIVVDNGSTDGTAGEARAAGAEVVVEPKRGYDAACLAGVKYHAEGGPRLFDACRERSVERMRKAEFLHQSKIRIPKSEIIVFMDGDGSCDPADLLPLVRPLLEGQADLVVGSRGNDLAERGSMTWAQRIGTALVVEGVRWGWISDATDIGPFRAITRKALERLGLEDHGFGWTVEMQMRAAEEGLKVVEAPVRLLRRRGTSKISGTWRGVWRAARGLTGRILAHLHVPPPLVWIALATGLTYALFRELSRNHGWLTAYLLLMGVLFVLFGAGAMILGRSVRAGVRGFHPKAAVSFFLVTGMVFRLLLFPVGPLTSDDVYRYVWDGKVQAHGINPYAYPPSHEAIADLRDTRIHPHINHPDLVTIYPPLAQMGFRLAYWFGGDTLWGFKVLSLAAELATCLVLLRLLAAVGRSPAWVMAYAWCPLPIVEFFANGHVDVLVIPLVTALAWAMVTRRWVTGGVSLVAAGMVKLLPFLLVPLFLRQLGSRRGRATALIGLEVAAVWMLSPFRDSLANWLATLWLYMQFWRFNGALYNWLAPFMENPGLTRAICLYGVILSALMIARKLRDPLTGMVWTLVGFAVCSPTVFPWYLVVLVPLLAAKPVAAGWGVVVLTQLSYIILIGSYRIGRWRENRLVLLMEYAPVVALIGWEWWKSRRRRSAGEWVPESWTHAPVWAGAAASAGPTGGSG